MIRMFRRESMYIIDNYEDDEIDSHSELDLHNEDRDGDVAAEDQ
jgi:hypothetical protein